MLAIDNGCTANGMAVEQSEKQTTGRGLLDSSEEIVGRHISAWLEPVMVAKQSHEGLEVLIATHLAHRYTADVGLLDALAQWLANAVGRLARMQTIMDAHPFYREEAILAESPVAKHLL